MCVREYRVVLQVQVREQRHVENRLPPDAAVTVRNSWRVKDFNQQHSNKYAT